MLIKNIEPVDHYKEAKQKIYSVIKLLNGSFESMNPIYMLILNIATLMPNVSILFKKNDAFPSAVSQVFRVFLITNISKTFGISSEIVAVICIIFAITIVLLTVFHLIFNSVFSFCSKLLIALLLIANFIAVPLIDFAAESYIQLSSSTITISMMVLNTLAMIFISISMIILGVYHKFNIRLLRKKNTLWNLSNDPQLYALAYLAFKTVFLSHNGATVSLCFLSLVVWFFHRSLPGGSINRLQHIIERSVFNYVAAADLGVLLSLVTKNQSFGMNIWIFATASFAIYACVEIYQSSRSRLFLPPCSSPPELFYNFFYAFKEEFKGEEFGANGSKKNFAGIFQLHRVHCPKEQCKLNSADCIETEDGVEEIVSMLIAGKKQQNLSNRLVHELWSLELGRKCEIDHLGDKPLTLKQDFALFCIDSLTRDSEVTIKNSESNKNVVAKVFYDLIFEISGGYAQFYEELARTHPKIDTIVRLGVGIRKKIAKLKTAYAELLKSKLINFKMIELYLEFFAGFVNENVLDRESVGRLMKVQQHMHFEDIAENYLPTFTIYPDSGNLENANSEAQKFLQSTRFELKYRNVADILVPTVAVQNLRALLTKETNDYEDEPIYSFFKKADGEHGCGTLKISQRFVKQKKLIIVQIGREPFSDLKCMFHVSSEFQLQNVSREWVRLKAGPFRSSPLTLSWIQLFKQYIYPNNQKLLKTKMMKITTVSNGCMLIVKKLNCLDEHYHILLAQIIVPNQNAKERKTSVLQNRRSFQSAKKNSHFEFHYGQDDDAVNEKLFIYGYKQPKRETRTRTHLRTLDKYEKGLQAMMVEELLVNNGYFGRDIKTYRLFDGQLYNVDLQDRQAYNQTFQGHVSQSKKKQTGEQSSLDCYIFMGVILLGLALIAFSVAFIIIFQVNAAQIQSVYSQYQNIASFNIDFQRLLTLLRDQSSGLLDQYPMINVNTQLKQSYGRIQILKNNTLFDNNQFSISFQGLIMTGTISELVDVILAHVTQIMDTNDLSIIEDIHDTCILQLNDMIESAQQNLLGTIDGYVSDIGVMKSVTLYCSVALLLILYFLMVLYCFKSSLKAREKLTQLMLVSDSEAKMLQENAEKMKYAVEMARKNFDVDAQGLLATGEFKKRKNPKEAALSRQIVYTISAITILGFILHVVCLFVFSSLLASQVSNFQTIMNQGNYVTSIYPQSCQLANQVDHKGYINVNMLNKIRSSLSQLEHNMNGLLFSKQLSNFIGTLYFENSCSLQLQMFNFSQTDCSNTAPGFTVTNPFEVGLALYFHRQNYYIYNNLTQNFAHTGVFSKQFARVYTNLTVYVRDEGVSALQESLLTVGLLNGLIILIDCAYIVAFVIIYRYFRDQSLKIKEILFFFISKKGPRVNNQQFDGQSDEQSLQQQTSPLKQEKSLNKSRKRRTTIQKKMQDQ